MFMTDISNLHLLAAKDSAMMADAENELERRLSLYEVFLKLYENHTSLLDEILQLENLYQPSLLGVKPRYVQGVVDNSVVYLITNLCEDNTQTLRQPQQVWTIGRASASGILIADKHISRRHAAIQYIPNQGFYLVDFNSTNGSYVNGEPVYQPHLLKDGDRIRLGSMTFSFFINVTTRVLPTVAIELLMQLGTTQSAQVQNSSQPPNKTNKKNLAKKPDGTLEILREQGVQELLGHRHNSLNAQQQSEILDRFFSRQAADNPS